MSVFFVPDERMPDARTMEASRKKISQDLDALLPNGFGGEGASLFAAPAAFMTLGASMAGHVFGTWLSAVSSSLQLAGEMSARKSPDVDTGSVAADVVAPVTAAQEDAGSAPVEAVSRPAAMDKPDRADDLKAISGVGPKLEKVLNGLGIWTYRQIADLGEPEVRWLDEELGFRGRIARDEWLKQSRELAARN